MPDGTSRLGERLKGWLQDLLELLGLDEVIGGSQERMTAWRDIRTAEDLRQYAADHHGILPRELALKAKQLGISDKEVMAIANPEFTDILENPSEWWANQIRSAFSSPVWTEINEIVGATAVDPFLTSLTAGKLRLDSPEMETVRRFLGTVSTFETLGNLITNVVETLSAGQIDSAGKIFSELKWTLGICFTSWQTTSPVIQATVLEPLQRLINREFRQTNFTRSQWMDLYALGKITPQRLGAELANLGYDDGKIQWLVDLAEKEPSRSDVLRMVDKGILGESSLAEALRREGYNQVWIDRFLRLYSKEETTEEKGAYIGTIRKAFREKLIGEAEIREALSRQGRSDEAIDLEIAVLKLDWEVEEKSAAKSDIRKAYMEDVIGEPEARHWLAEAGFATHTIDLLLDTWKRERAPKYKKLNKSEALKAWSLGVLTRPQTFQLLVDVGYDEQGATVLMETYQKAHMQVKPPETYVMKPTDVMWAWHTEVLEEDEALAKLGEIGLTAEDAEIVFETFQRLHPRIAAVEPKELKKEDILEAWGRGVIDEDACFAKLLAVGWSETDADLLMTSFQQRPAALPPEPTISALIASTRRGVIDQATLSQKLTTMGIREEDVEFWVAYATAPEPEATRQLSRTDILRLWTEGRHDRAWALQRLLAMNYSEDDAQDILWLASPEITDTETYVLWKAGIIEDEVAWAMWSSMGFSEAQIAEVLETE
jgi:SOS response regulatory protein OraA/RecX